MHTNFSGFDDLLSVEESNSLLKAVIECSDDGICAVQGLQEDKRLIIYNRRYLELLDIPYNHDGEYDYNKGIKLTYEKVKDKKNFMDRVTYLYEHPEETARDIFELVNGRIINRLSMPYRHDGKIIGRVWIYRDITEQKKNEEMVKRIAYYDDLTGLPNRRLFMDRLERTFYRAKRNAAMFALFFIDLDKFKSINDSYGHVIGDKILIEAASRFKNCIKKGITAARIGGDEFTILVSSIKYKEDLKKIAEKILSEFHQPIKISNTSLFITPSIGISIYPDNGITITDILKSADDAMYTSKYRSDSSYEFSKFII